MEEVWKCELSAGGCLRPWKLVVKRLPGSQGEPELVPEQLGIQAGEGGA